MRIEQRLGEILNIERLQFPGNPPVIGIRYEHFEDSTGDDAVRVFVVFDEATPDEQRMWPAVQPIEETIRAALYDAEIDTWPYFRYRKPSELPAANP